jgi:hypothetical protein
MYIGSGIECEKGIYFLIRDSSASLEKDSTMASDLGKTFYGGYSCQLS